jgi:hypothetical protein
MLRILERIIHKCTPEIDYPIYSISGDFLLVGTHHGKLPTENAEKLEKFLHHLNNAAHVFVEGRTAKIPSPLPTFEEVAARHGRSKVIYLEQERTYARLVKPYGISDDLCSTLWLLSQTDHVEKTAGEVTVDSLEFFRKICGGIYDEYDTQAYKRAVGIVADLWKRVSSTDTEFLKCVGAYFAEFTWSLRDYEYICPNIKRLSTLEGKKMVVLGNNHIKPIRSVLKGKTLKPPLTWEAYKAKQGSYYHEYFNLVEHSADYK